MADRARATTRKKQKRQAKAAGKLPRKKVAARKSSPASSRAATSSAAAAGRAVYLYGISRILRAAKVAAPGVDGASKVEALEFAGLLCWVSRVDRIEYGEELANRIQNLDWLAGASLRHQRVISELAGARTILPARFGTVFLSDESLRDDVEGRQQQLRDSLDRIEGKEEWGVKVYARGSTGSVPVEAASGAEYLRAKAAVLEARARVELDPEIVEFAKELQAIATASAATGRVSSGQRNLQWQASFLVPAAGAARKKWESTLKKYAGRWAETREIELTGPWPPYSFL